MLTRSPRIRRGAAHSAPKKALLIAALGLLVASVHAADRQPTTPFRELLIEAIDRGTASGELGGEVAGFMAKHFQSTAPIMVEVKTVAALREAGCKRLAVTTTQDGVVDFNAQSKANAPKRATFTYEVNYCRDGRIPSEGARR